MHCLGKLLVYCLHQAVNVVTTTLKRLTLSSTIISVYSENHTKHINTPLGQNAVHKLQCVLHGVITVLNMLTQFTRNCSALFHFSGTWITFDSQYGTTGIIGAFLKKKKCLGVL